MFSYNHTLTFLLHGSSHSIYNTLMSNLSFLPNLIGLGKTSIQVPLYGMRSQFCVPPTTSLLLGQNGRALHLSRTT